MSLQTCITEAKAWADKNSELKLDKGEIENLGRLLEAAHNAGATPAEKMQLMQEAVTRRIAMAQLAQRGEAALNSLKHLQNTYNITKNIELWGNTDEAAPDALEALITGKSARPGFGVNNDPLAASRANMTRYVGFLENALSKSESKLLKAGSAGDNMSRDITQELAALRDKTPLGQSGNDVALSIAKKMREAGDAVFNEAKAVNPYLKENLLYLFSRSHNQELIAKVPQAEWVADARAAYGKNLIGSPEQIDEMLGKTYREIKAGLPAESSGVNPRFWEPQGTSGSQAARNAGQRVFIANDWQSEFAYNAKYGDSPYNAFLKQAQRQADYVATTNKWGTQPANAFERLYQGVYRALETPEQKELLNNRKADLKEKFEATQATSDSAVWTIKGRLAQGLLSAENLSMLGNHVPRTLTSGPAIMAQIRDGYGKNIFENATAVAQSVFELMKNVGDGGAKELGHLGVSSMSVGRDMTNRLAAGNGQPLGAMAKLGNLLSRATLADYTTNAWKFIMAETDTRHLGDFAGKTFDKLPAVTQEMLQRYGLDGQKWEVLRQTVQDGRITPEGVNRVTKSAGITEREHLQNMGEIAQNLGTMLNERASMTVGQSNSSTRAAAYGLSDLNSYQGVARNFLMQYKQVSMARQQFLARTYRSGGGDTSNIGGTIQYMLGAAFAGMVGQQMVELGANREPLNVSDPKILAHMIRSTGMLGIGGDLLADFLTANGSNDFKKITQGDILGPSFGTLSKAGEAAFRTSRGVVQYAKGEESENQFGGKQWANLIHGLTPGQNLFYAKGGLDYTLFNELHNFMGDHGFMGMARQQMMQHKNISGDTQKNILE